VIKRLLGMPSVQIALCLAVFALVGWRFGAFAIVWSAPLLGAALCRPIMALVASIRHGARARVWLPVHGQHYVYKGVTIHVQQDEDRCRWVPLAVTFPGRCKPLGKPAQPCLRDDALVEHLGRENNPAALRLRTWVERTIVLPGRKVRSNLGIRPEPPDA
jgi:hypothetical protein